MTDPKNEPRERRLPAIGSPWSPLVVLALATSVACGSGSAGDTTGLGPGVTPSHPGRDAGTVWTPWDASPSESGEPVSPTRDAGATAETGASDATMIDRAEAGASDVTFSFDSILIAGLCAASGSPTASCDTCTVAGDQLVGAAPTTGDAGDGGVAAFSRTLGAGRHAVAAGDSGFAAAYVTTTEGVSSLSVAAFTGGGAPLGTASPPAMTSALLADSNPVVAPLGCGTYAVAWTDGGDGDELGVAVSVVQPSTGQTTGLVYANTTRKSSQFDPDILSLGSQLIVAWVDDSDAATAPDLRYRTWDVSTGAVSGELTLAATGDSEGDVALAPFAGSWAAAWRDDASGVETIRVHAASSDWTVGPAFLPGPAGVKPALAQLDATHLLVAYAVGVDPADTGVANESKVSLAVLDAAAPGAVSGVDLVPLLGSTAGLGQSAPSLVTASDSKTYLAWWTDAALGNPKKQELWLKELTWDGTTLGTSLPEVPLPAQTLHQLGDQRAPALAVSTATAAGSLVSAWDDLGQTFASGEGQGDVVVRADPLPLGRLECAGAVANTGPALCPAGVMYVSAEAGNDANTGCSPCAPKRSIGSALAALQAAGAPADAGVSAFEVRVCAGTYNETSLGVNLPVSLLGGYDCGSWTRTSTYGWPSFDGANETVVQNAQFASQASTLVVTAPALVDGFTFHGAVQSTARSHALEVRAPIGVTVSNDRIIGGSNVSTNIDTFGSVALYLNGDLATTVMQNWIDGGTGTVSQGMGSLGIYLFGATAADKNFPSIHDNHITGGTGATTTSGRGSTGMAIAKAGDFRANPTWAITRNYIDGGTSNLNTAGIIEGIAVGATSAVVSANDIRGGNTLGLGGPTGIAWPFGSLVAIGNRIYGGNAPANTNDGEMAISTYGSSSPVTIVNNMIHGGQGPFPIGINLVGNGDVVAYNTIFGGVSPPGFGGTGIFLGVNTFGALVGAQVFNNLFLSASSGHDVAVVGGWCMGNSPGPIKTFQNNAFIGASVPFQYGDALQAPPTCPGAPAGPYTLALMEQEMGRSGTATGNVMLGASLCPGAGCDSACTLGAGTEATCLESLLPSWSPDHGFTTLTTSAFPLQAGDPCLVTRGGLVDSTLGAIEQTDFFGNARGSAGTVSIGAAEFDGSCQ